MLNSQQLHLALNEIGCQIETGAKDPSYAYEHYLGGDKYIYIKKVSGDTSKPLVLHPGLKLNQTVFNSISGINIEWEPRKNTSYRNFPKFEGKSQYGYAANIESVEALKELVEKIKTIELGKVAAENRGTKMKSAMEINQPLNQILYGPPGTGKTYHTINAALQILDPEFYELNKSDRNKLKARFNQLKDEEKIGFVTFHQSFSYEDFVEGIKAVEVNGRIMYEVVGGIFRNMCDEDEPELEIDSSSSVDITGKNIWKMSLGNSLAEDAYIYEYCLENDEIRLGYGREVDFSECDDRQKIVEIFVKNNIQAKEQDYRVTAVNCFKNEMKIGDLVVITNGNTKFRAIAEITGDYQCLPSDDVGHYGQTRKVIWHRVYENSINHDKIMYKKFMQKSVYNLKPNAINLEKLQILLTNKKSIISPELNSTVCNKVLIIDEINRGNISSIFGELITLLESSKRKGSEEELSVTLPYSKKSFTVPKELHIIGTMNTADRSLALMDTALRRRFDFEEMMPEPEKLAGLVIEGINVQQMLVRINERIQVLYDREHTIGHAFFIGLFDINEEKRFAELRKIFSNKILPLLEEYFFEDWEKIRLVLADNQKGEDLQFIRLNKSYNAQQLFGDIDDYRLLDEDIKVYSRYTGELEPKAFIQIYER